MKRVFMILIVVALCSVSLGDYFFSNGTTSKSLDFLIRGPTGEPNAALTVTNLDLYVTLVGNVRVKLGDLALHDGADWNDLEAIHLGGGHYRVDIPDANLSDGVGSDLIYEVNDPTTTNNYDQAWVIVHLNATVDVNTVGGTAPFNASTGSVQLSSASIDAITDAVDSNCANLLAGASDASSAASSALDAKTAAEKIDEASEMRTFLFGADVEGATEPNQTTANSTIATNLDAAVSTRATPETVWEDPNASGASAVAIAEAVWEDANGILAFGYARDANEDVTSIKATIGAAGAGLTGIPGIAGHTLMSGTVASYATKAVTLSASFPATTSAYPEGTLIVIVDAHDSQGYVNIITGYTSGRVASLAFTPPFTPTAGDAVYIIPAWVPSR